MKKLFFFLSCLVVTSCVQSNHVSVGAGYGLFQGAVNVPTEGKVFFGLAATALAAKIGYDLSWHKTYTQNVETLCKSVEETLQSNNISTIEDLVSQRALFADQILPIKNLTTWLNNSYNCWLTPWNWAESQKIAFYNSQKIAALTLYLDLIAKKFDDSLVASDILQWCRTNRNIESIYPLIDGYNFMMQQSNLLAQPKLRSSSYSNIDVLASQACKYIAEFASILAAQAEFTQEQQTKKLHTTLQAIATNVSFKRY